MTQPRSYDDFVLPRDVLECCPVAMDKCRTESPPTVHVGNGDAEHDVVCWAVAESAAAREAAS